MISESVDYEGQSGFDSMMDETPQDSEAQDELDDSQEHRLMTNLQNYRKEDEH